MITPLFSNVYLIKREENNVKKSCASLDWGHDFFAKVSDFTNGYMNT